MTPSAYADMNLTVELQSYTVPLKPYAEDPELKRYFIDRLSRDGLAGAVCYYKVLAQSKMLEDDKEILKNPDNKVIKVPYLYVGFTGDWVSRPEFNRPIADAGMMLDYEEIVVDAGHWSLYEKPVEIAGILVDWLMRRGFTGEGNLMRHFLSV